MARMNARQLRDEAHRIGWTGWTAEAQQKSVDAIVANVTGDGIVPTPPEGSASIIDWEELLGETTDGENGEDCGKGMR